MWPPSRLNEETHDIEMSNDFGMDQEIIRRLVERIIKLEVDQETLKRQVEEPLVGNDIFGNDEDGSNSKIILWNRILRLEEGQQVVQKHVQELFANVMDFELQSRGEPCYLHDPGTVATADNKPKHPTRQWLKDLRRSLNKSTHPALKHLTDFGHPILRVFWAVALCAVALVCVESVYHSYCQWRSGPLSSHSDTEVPLGSIPFPAVTVCPERNIGAGSHLETLLTRCNSYVCSKEEFDQISAAAFLCPSLMDMVPQSWSNYYNITSPKFMQELMSSCKEDISSYHWSDKGTEMDCTKAFQTVYMDDRVCFSYNMLPASYIFKANVSSEPVMTDHTGLAIRKGWTPHTLARPDPGDKSLPRHRNWAGEDEKFIINLDRKNFTQPSCVDRFQSFQVAVHHPAELPSRSALQYLRLPPSHSLLIAVTPLLESSPQGCLDTRDGRLRMFRHYSTTKCHLECRVKCSVNLCGCVPMYLPRMNNSTRWCGLSRRFCPDSLVPELLRGTITWEAIAKHYRMLVRDDLREAVTDLLYRYPGQGQETDNDRTLDLLRPDCSCHCPPACATVAYRLDTQLVPLAGVRGNSNWNNKSEINIYYKEGIETVTATKERREMKYFIDFIAHAGGLVALLTGVSLLSLVEAVYLTVAALLRPHHRDTSDVTRQTSCLRRRHEWDKTAQTDPIFITDGHLNAGF